VTWVDERSDRFPQQVGHGIGIEAVDDPVAEVATAPPDSIFLVMTHSHPLDQALAEAILRRGDFRYFGLIGSLSKRRQFERRLAARGLPPAALLRMVCPIGIPGMESKEPAAIAVAVAAQLLPLLRHRQAPAGLDSGAAGGDGHGAGIATSVAGEAGTAARAGASR
jgi:xanthine dehydrogenase accessory factor